MLAGRRRTVSTEAWRAHLDRDVVTGQPLAWHRQLGAAFGFLGAAAKMRCWDLCQQLCRPLDWVVAAHGRSAALVVQVVVASIVSLHTAGGWPRVWEEFEQVGVVFALASGVVYGWRQIRGITPPARQRPSSQPPDGS